MFISVYYYSNSCFTDIFKFKKVFYLTHVPIPLCRSLLKSTTLVTTLGTFFYPSLTTRTSRLFTASAFRPALYHVLSPSPTSAESNNQNNPRDPRKNDNKILQQRHMTMSSNDEQAKAQGAGPEEVTIFDKIVSGEIPCKELYSDDKCLAFHDVNPQVSEHVFASNLGLCYFVFYSLIPCIFTNLLL